MNDPKSANQHTGLASMPAPSGAVPSLNAQLKRTGRLFGGITQDIKRRLPWYVDDFKQGAHTKVVASTLFLFFACLANAVAFGGLTGLVTEGQIGTVEMIVATAVGGIFFALTSAQPLTILGGTGPIVIFTGLVYAGCSSLGLPFLPVYAWIGIWSSLLLILAAVTDASFLMGYFTRFTDEIFAALIAIIFIVEAIESSILPLFLAGETSTAELLALVLAIGTFMIARALGRFSQTPFLWRRVREFITDFGPALAIGVMTVFALLQPDVQLEPAAIPEKFSTTIGRPWRVDLFAVPTWSIIASIGPALMATILLFLDQNITARLVSAPAHGLMKGAGFHLDLAVVGMITGVCSLFGLPWIVAATVHALNHVRSLADVVITEEAGQRQERIVRVRENRVSPLMIHVMIACSIFILPVIKLIPMAVLFGLFLYMGFATLAGNQFFHRVTLWVTDPKLYPDTHYVRQVPHRTMHVFTLIQVLCLAALWVLKESPLGILFPVLIALLVPFRLLLERFFARPHLEALDVDEAEELDEKPAMMASDIHG